MTIVEIYGLFCLILAAMYVLVESTLFRRWYSRRRFWKGLARLVVSMAVGAAGIMVMVLVLVVTPVYMEYVDKMIPSQTYIWLVGDSPLGAHMGLVVVLDLIIVGVLWGIARLGDCIIPRSVSEKQLDDGVKEWLNSKLPKLLRSRKIDVKE